MRTASSLFVALAIGIGIVAPLPASAQSAEAEVLFREGRRLEKEGRIAEACDKLEASERLEPTFGTEYDLADCREQNGQTATAWAMFVKAAATAKKAKDERAADARERADALEGKLVHLTIVVPAESDLDELVIKRDDTPVDRALWNQKVPVDPEKYTISAEAPGREPWSETVVIKTKNKVIEVPKLERAAVKPRKHAPVTRREPERVEAPGKYHTTAIALAAIGVGALGIGTGFAVYSSNVESQSDALCPGIKCADAHAIDLNKTARLDATIADVAWGVGGAAVIGAAVAWWLGRSDADGGSGVSVVPVAERGGAGLALGGRF